LSLKWGLVGMVLGSQGSEVLMQFIQCCGTAEYLKQRRILQTIQFGGLMENFA
jgi:hypothetical protein